LAPVIRTVGVPTQADFADQSIDILEISAGEYSPGVTTISGIDRSARPLIVRPSPGASVVWNGSGAADGAFYFGWPTRSPAIGFTFDGRNGSGSSWLFTNYNLGSTGIFWTGGSRALRFLGLTFNGNTGIRAGANSHTFYVSNNNEGSEDGRSRDIEIAFCSIDGGGRTVTASQCYHDPGPIKVDFHDNAITNCDYGCVWWANSSTDMAIRNNRFSDCDYAIDVRNTEGVASGNVSNNARAYIEAPFSDDGTNSWDPPLVSITRDAELLKLLDATGSPRGRGK
jgi:hypothetical protein